MLSAFFLSAIHRSRSRRSGIRCAESPPLGRNGIRRRLTELTTHNVPQTTNHELRATNYELKCAHFSAFFTQFFEYFRMFSNISHNFSNVFEYFQTFSNVFECFFLTYFTQTPQLDKPTLVFTPKTNVTPEKQPEKPYFPLNHDNFSPNFVNSYFVAVNCGECIRF